MELQASAIALKALNEEKEVMQKRITELQKNNKDLLESNINLKNEITQLRIEVLKCGRSEKSANFTFFISWVVFTIVLYLKE